jgi:IclR family mhp operon transcriptional activator
MANNASGPTAPERPPTATLLRAGEPALDHAKAKLTARGRCRTNSRRGITDPAQRSYPPVESVCRALDVLRTVNRLGIASVHAIYAETGFPKPTIVRMLETLSAEGYIARDNMCGGYWVTSRVHDLTSGYRGTPHVIEAARPLAIDLTRRIKWPIGIGVIDGDAIAIKFWTGAISPWAHTNTVLGLRPDLLTSAMGRAYVAFCADGERERHIVRLRADRGRGFGPAEERRFRALLDQIRRDGYAMRDPKT